MTPLLFLPIPSAVKTVSRVWGGCSKCKRPAELAIVAEEGSDAGPILRAVNFVAAGIEAEFPQVAIDLLAYSFAQNPPRKTKARSNVIVRMALGQNKGAPASDATNANFSRIVRGWGEASQRLYLWSYDANCARMQLQLALCPAFSNSERRSCAQTSISSCHTVRIHSSRLLCPLLTV